MARGLESEPKLIIDTENASRASLTAINPRIFVGALLAAIVFAGAAFVFFGLGSASNDNFPDPEDDFWKKFFNPDF